MLPPAPLALLAVNIDAANGGDVQHLALREGDAEKPGQSVGGTLLAHCPRLLEDVLGFGFAHATLAHAGSGHDQRASRVGTVLSVVPAPRDKPPPKIFGICCADVQR